MTISPLTPQPFTPSTKKALSKLDTNHNGVTAKELVKLDTNHDFKLSTEELTSQGISPEDVKNVQYAFAKGVATPDIALFPAEEQHSGAGAAGHKAVHKTVEEGIAKGLEHGIHHAAEKAAEKAIEKAAEKTAMSVGEKVVEKAVEKTAEKAVEKTAEKVAVKTTEKAVEKTAEKVAVKAVEKAVEKTAEKVAVKTTEKVVEKVVQKTAMTTAARLGTMAPYAGVVIGSGITAYDTYDAIQKTRDKSVSWSSAAFAWGTVGLDAVATGAQGVASGAFTTVVAPVGAVAEGISWGATILSIGTAAASEWLR